MIDAYSAALAPAMNAAFMRWWVAFVVAAIVALVLQAFVGLVLGALLLFVVLAGGFAGIVIVRARSPKLLTLAADGISIDGPTGRSHFDAAEVAFWDITSSTYCLVTKRSQHGRLPVLAQWNEGPNKPAVVERFRAAGIEIRSRGRWR